MFDLLKKAENVARFEKGDRQFWQEPYISEQLLTTHLSQEVELASRNWSFIQKSAAFITTNLVEAGERVIDFGCGPGLYCQLLGGEHQVTGVDFSERSIAYATSTAQKMGLSINYHCLNYLEWQGDQSYDLALMIYCDYGALDPRERQRVLKNISGSLKVGGKLFLDVFSIAKYQKVVETRDWYSVSGPGFWCQQEHSVVSQVKKYSDFAVLEQSIVLTVDKTEVYNIWYQYFDQTRLKCELNAAGFEVIEWMADVAGGSFQKTSQTVALVARKKSANQFVIV